MNRLRTPEFKDFVKGLLKLGGLSRRCIEKCTDESSMRQFRTSFVHKSINTDASSNYELAEIQGDGIVNSIIVNYIRVKFPDVVNVGWIAKLKIHLISKRSLFILAQRNGFGRFISYSDEYASKFRDIPDNRKHLKSEYISLYEDTFEAFIGTMVNVIDEKIAPRMKMVQKTRTGDKEVSVPIPGPGYAATTMMIYSILDELNIPLRYDVIWDPISRLKSIYDKRKTEYGWEFNKMYKRFKRDGPGGPEYTVKIYAPVRGDKRFRQENLELIGEFTSVSNDEARYQAAFQALDSLAKLGIRDTPKDPYIRKN